MYVVILSSDYFSAVGIQHCLLEGGINDAVIGNGNWSDDRAEQSVVVVIDAGCGDAQTDKELAWARDQRLPALVVFAESRKPWIDRAVTNGAKAVLTRAEAREHLPLAVRVVNAGQIWISKSVQDAADAPRLSTREVDTLRLYCEGLKIDAIARRLHVSSSTVNTYLTRIRTKYTQAGRPVRTRLELRREAIKDGWVSATDSGR